MYFLLLSFPFALPLCPLLLSFFLSLLHLLLLLLSFSSSYSSISLSSLPSNLCSLEESGQTALGPALLVSVVMASKVPGQRSDTTLGTL